MTTHTSTKACDVCRDIKLMVTSEGNLGDGIKFSIQFTRVLEGNLGPVANILSEPCSGHDSLLRFVMQHLANRGELLGPRDELVLFPSGSGVDEERYAYGPTLLLAGESSQRQLSGLGRILHKDWVDINLLREWIDECTEKHDCICSNRFQLARIPPAWLIDTIDNCLITGDGVEDYIALSYTWGNATQLQNKLCILDRLQRPGALDQTQFANLLSPTLKHAIALARILGERYLWADTLCIVQDDGEQTTAQIKLIGLIFASAKLTIVATDGDATHGIPGLKRISPSRELDQLRFPLGEGDSLLIRQNPSFSHGFGCSPYFERAWTFQEYILSRRCLIIGNGQFHWSCSYMTHHEDLQGPDPGHVLSKISSQFLNILSGVPDFFELSLLLKEYNARELTFPEDTLAGGFIYGIAEMRFNSSLMWTSCHLRPNMQRRIHSGKNHTALHGSRLPSWSWVGWKGDDLLLAAENSGELNHSTYITRRITQWYSQETPFSSTKCAIQPSFLDPIGYSRDDASKVLLLEGWQREKFDASQHVTQERLSRGDFPVLGEYVYKHPKLPGKLFWRQFHVKDIRKDSGLSLPPQHPFLSCKTKRGWFGAKLLTEAKFICDNLAAHVLVLGKDGIGCGFLQLHSEEQEAAFPTAESKDSRTIELVAICFRTKPIILTDAAVVEDLIARYGEFQEMYGVLWIEWIDKIAYRKGAGYIRKERWESHELEDVDLILG
ncbi:HET-domain-containing protein [Xylaria arbuscula]|nr:HET-domain-containing protein [Xylaria arbuscula]